MYKIGDIATEDLIDPASGEVIIEKGQVVTRERISLIESIERDIVRYQEKELKK